MIRLCAVFVLLLGVCLARAENTPLEASVVIRTVENSSTTGVGSGTVVHAKPGRCLIATAGHLFRDSQGRAAIQIAFHDGRTAAGYIVSWKDNPDIALVQAQVNPPAVATVAKYDPPLHEAVSRIGMFGIYAGSVRSLNRYTGAANIETAGASIEADSGGGIFNARGELVGVTVATDAEETIGTGLRIVHQELARLDIKEVGCRWVRDQNGNCVRVCDNAPLPVAQPIMPPLQPIQPPAKPPVTGSAGPAGPPGPPGPAGPQGAPGKDAVVNVDALSQAIAAKVEQNLAATIDQRVAQYFSQHPQPPATLNFVGTDGKTIATATIAPGATTDVKLPPINFRVQDARGGAYSTDYQPAQLGSYVTLPFGPAP